jgi:phenylpropionate dioxygenase-like ring-hydroxylating dioxygenase large terminal subunit
MDDKGKDRLIIGGGTAAGAVPADKLDALRPTAGTAVEPVNLTPLRRYWHPVADAADVRDAPISVRLLNESIVIFRSGDRVSAFKDLCLHRGAKISMGKVRDGNIICPYHGLEYDGDGRCVYIPSQPRHLQKIPPRLRLIRYHCEIRYGLVWVALEEPVAPIPPFPQFEDPSFKVWRAFRSTWQASAARWIENALDISHFPIVHPGLLGDPEHPQLEPFEVVRSDGGLFYEFDWIQPIAPYGNPVVHYQYFLDFPFTIRLAIHNEIGITLITGFTLPTAGNECSMWIFLGRNHSFELPDSDLTAFLKTLLLQDQAVTEQQHPEMLPVDLTAEVHLRVADAPGVAFRRLLREIGLTYA